MSDSTLVHPPTLPRWGGLIPGQRSPQEPRALRKGLGGDVRNKQGKGAALLPVLPHLTPSCWVTKTFNYRYLVPLRIPSVLITSSLPPRTSFHGKNHTKSQGGEGENSHPRGFPAKRGERRVTGRAVTRPSSARQGAGWVGRGSEWRGTRPGFWCMGLALPALAV